MSAKRKPKPRKKPEMSALEKKMSPENYKLLLEIRAIRDSIGPVSFNSGDLIRELRENDD